MNKIKDSDYHFEYQEEPIQEDEQVLNDGISDEAALKKNMERIKPFRIFIKDAHGIVLGGASGTIFYGSLYVDMLWLKEELRHQGLGRKLMMEAEKIGRERQCTFVTLNTMDWEALSFYQKLGYEIEFVRKGYSNDSQMYMLRKEL
ncbi:putative acetyltransferase [Candidatus Rubidus massiliensis]|nr:putative acetyltransferase [Candidatus Rubidus massiliensis]